MGTRSTIALLINDEVIYTKCLFDGSPNYLGKILINHYIDINKINTLIINGVISVIDKEIFPPKEIKNKNNKRIKGFCEYVETNIHQNLILRQKYIVDDYIKNHACEEYNYIFDSKTKSWHIILDEKIINTPIKELLINIKNDKDTINSIFSNIIEMKKIEKFIELNKNININNKSSNIKNKI